jgi:hypothetical protein
MLMETSPRCDVDGGGDGPRRGLVCRWRHARASSAGRGAPFRRAWRCGRRGPSQEWPVVVTGRVEACPRPSSVRSLTPVSSFYLRGSKGDAGLRGIRALTQRRSRAFGVGRNRAPLLGVGRGVARSQGVGCAEPVPQGSGVPDLPPRGRLKPRSRPLLVPENWYPTHMHLFTSAFEVIEQTKVI